MLSGDWLGLMVLTETGLQEHHNGGCKQEL